MSYLTSSTPSLQSTERTGRGVRRGNSQPQSPHIASIHILNDDSLLHVFYLYRPFFFREDEDDYNDGLHLFMGHVKPEGKWAHGRWWCKLAHVCQRWRNVILGSASYLGVSLVCTNGTPVADMLAHSPPLPLVIDYADRMARDTPADKEGMIVALKQHERVRRVRLRLSISTNLAKFFVAKEYPIMEYLAIVQTGDEDDIESSTFPETFHAPHLRHLLLSGFAPPAESRLLTTAVGLVKLCFFIELRSAYFQPNTLLRWISSMPQLEKLEIIFLIDVPYRDLERQLTHTPVMPPVTLPNLHHFKFRGVSTYLEALVRRITTPRLKRLRIDFSRDNSNQRTPSVPSLQQFINTTENFRFDRAKFMFSTARRHVYVEAYPRGVPEMDALHISVGGWDLAQQVSSIAQISTSLAQMFSAVKHLTLEYEQNIVSILFEGHNEVDPRTEWRNLLRPFSNVKTLWVDKGLVKELSHCLELDDGELSLELIPELQELTYSGSGDAFTSFIETRQNEGRPVVLVHRSPAPAPAPTYYEYSETSSTTSGSSEAGDYFE